MTDLRDLPLERMRELTDAGGPVAARWCARCDRHYRFCGCDEPAWRLRARGVLGPLPGETGGPISLQEEVTGRRERWPDWNGPDG